VQLTKADDYFLPTFNMSEMRDGHNNQHTTLRRTDLRADDDWNGERPLTYCYYNHKKNKLAEMASEYVWGAVGVTSRQGPSRNQIGSRVVHHKWLGARARMF